MPLQLSVPYDHSASAAGVPGGVEAKAAKQRAKQAECDVAAFAEEEGSTNRSMMKMHDEGGDGAILGGEWHAGRQASWWQDSGTSCAESSRSSTWGCLFTAFESTPRPKRGV
jgi:hypothetical protein